MSRIGITFALQFRKIYRYKSYRERKKNMMTLSTFLATAALMFGVISLIAIHMGNGVEA